jgi:hypothetical protein
VMMLQAPASGTLTEVRGLRSALRVKHVDELIITAHPGRPLSPLPDGFLYLGFIFARADTPARVERALRGAFSELTIVIDRVPSSAAYSPTS